jgi:hypothetical protein
MKGSVRRDLARRSGALYLTVCVLLALASCSRFQRYVVPKGDGGTKHAVHALQGRITAVEADKLTVVSDGGETVVVPTTPSTRFYKLVGGVVLRPELMPGHRVRVWYTSSKPPVGPAAVVMLASLDPTDDWPK